MGRFIAIFTAILAAKLAAGFAIAAGFIALMDIYDAVWAALIVAGVLAAIALSIWLTLRLTRRAPPAPAGSELSLLALAAGKKLVRDNPVTAVTAAAALGFLIMRRPGALSAVLILAASQLN